MKKTIIVVVCLLLTCNILTNTVTAVTVEEQYAGEQLRTLKLMKGFPNGTLGLEKPIERAQVAALLVRTLGYEEKEVAGQGKVFSDVKADLWAKDEIQKAYKLQLIVGDPGGTFRPTDNISYAEVVTILINALGQGKNLEGDWPMNYINKAKQLGIVSTQELGDIRRIVTRGEVSVLLWDTILTKS